MSGETNSTNIWADMGSGIPAATAEASQNNDDESIRGSGKPETESVFQQTRDSSTAHQPSAAPAPDSAHSAHPELDAHSAHSTAPVLEADSEHSPPPEPEEVSSHPAPPDHDAGAAHEDDEGSAQPAPREHTPIDVAINAPIQIGPTQLAPHNFNEDDPLGAGAYGVVNVITVGGVMLARKSFLGGGFDTELTTYQTLQENFGYCPFIIQMLDSNPINRTIDLELAMGGSLECLRDNYFAYESSIALWAIENLEALAFMGRKDLIHCDVKPANILLTADLHVKLCDFGLTKRRAQAPAYQFIGTHEYVAPEVFVNPQHNQFGLPYPLANYNLDTWSLGVTLYKLLCGEYPWPPSAEPHIPENREEAVRAGHVAISLEGCPQPKSQNFAISKEMIRLITKKMLIHSPARRPNPTALLRDEFVVWLRTQLTPLVVPKIYRRESAPVRTPLRNPFELKEEIELLEERLRRAQERLNAADANRVHLLTELARLRGEVENRRTALGDVIQARDQLFTEQTRSLGEIQNLRTTLSDAVKARDRLITERDRGLVELIKLRSTLSETLQIRDRLLAFSNTTKLERDSARAAVLAANDEHEKTKRDRQSLLEQLAETRAENVRVGSVNTNLSSQHAVDRTLHQSETAALMAESAQLRTLVQELRSSNAHLLGEAALEKNRATCLQQRLDEATNALAELRLVQEMAEPARKLAKADNVPVVQTDAERQTQLTADEPQHTNTPLDQIQEATSGSDLIANPPTIADPATIPDEGESQPQFDQSQDESETVGTDFDLRNGTSDRIQPSNVQRGASNSRLVDYSMGEETEISAETVEQKHSEQSHSRENLSKALESLDERMWGHHSGLRLARVHNPHNSQQSHPEDVYCAQNGIDDEMESAATEDQELREQQKHSTEPTNGQFDTVGSDSCVAAPQEDNQPAPPPRNHMSPANKEKIRVAASFHSISHELRGAALRLAQLKLNADSQKESEIVVPRELEVAFELIHQANWSPLGELHCFAIALLNNTRAGTIRIYNKVPRDRCRGDGSFNTFFSKILPHHPYSFTLTGKTARQ